MTRVIFKGPETNLGRFGAVHEGDVLILTDQEFSTVTADKRFEVVPANKRLPVPGPKLIPITKNMSTVERDAAEKANREEKGRFESLTKANDSDVVEVLEIKTKTMEELVDLADQINDQEKRSVIDTQRSSKAELIRRILAYRREHVDLVRGAVPAGRDDRHEEAE